VTMYEEGVDVAPAQWNFTPAKGEFGGPVLEAVFVLVRRVTTKFGEGLVAELEMEDGTPISLGIFGTVLRNQFLEVRPKTGEKIKVCHLGKKKSATGNEYSNFRVTCPDRPQQGVAWDDIDPRPQPAMPAAAEVPANGNSQPAEAATEYVDASIFD
jgi:hypothetical protein